MPDGDPVIFETHHRVRFREIDSYGHMNMSHYLTYYTDHRFEGMRTRVALDLKAISALPIAFHTRHLEIDYIRPLFADQEFTIRSQVEEWRRTYLMVGMQMIAGDGEILSRCTIKVGCIDRTSGRPTTWPTEIKARFFRSATHG